MVTFATMKVIHISSLPLMRNFYAINLFGIVLARGRLTEKEKRHEYIHTLQQREMLFVFFFIWYVAEWLVRLAIYRNFYRAYRNISFEREAYLHQDDEDYPKKRKHFAFLIEN